MRATPGTTVLEGFDAALNVTIADRQFIVIEPLRQTSELFCQETLPDYILETPVSIARMAAAVGLA